MFKKDNKYSKEIISSACLLFSIAYSDEKWEKNEIECIKEILIDFFNLENTEIDNIIKISLDKLEHSTDLYEFSKDLNSSFTYQDKIDFICCAFEVSNSDKNMHYLEEFFIKKIANTLNVNHNDLIEAKNIIKKQL